MKFYIAMFIVLAVVLVLIPTAGQSGKNLVTGSQQASTNSIGESSGQAPEEATPTEEIPAKDEAASPGIKTDSAKTNDVEAVSKQKAFRVKNQTTGEVDIVSVVDYVRGAVCSEMPATFHTEALKAQAVAAHTYALNLQLEAEREGRDFDFSADPMNWKGYVTEAQAKERFGVYFESYWGKTREAADSVCGEIIVYDSLPIAAAYHAISAGQTEAAENVWGNQVDYLLPVDSKGDLRAPGYEETKSLPAAQVKEDFQKAFPELKLSGEEASWFSVKSRSDSGYVTELKAGDGSVTGLEFREALGLRSSDFTIDSAGGNFTITTLGYGHGVGLSQYGADYMARQGASYKEILTHYYQGATVGKS